MKNVLITGASSGIGAATALHLDSVGMRVFAGLRDMSDSGALTTPASQALTPVQLDITSDASVAAAVDTLSRACGEEGLWGLVNSAGEAYPGPLETLPIEELQKQLDVNVLGQVRVTQAFLPLVRRSRGRIVFVGSIGGKTAFEFAGAYHASKFAMEAIADVWRQELHTEGLSVSLIEPGPISTRIWDKGVARLDAMLADPAPSMNRYRERLQSYQQKLVSGDKHGGSPESVARVIEKTLTTSRPSTRYPVGVSARVTSAMAPFIPDRVFDAFGRRLGG